jgi:glycerol-3-phosphate dehydrogenase
VALAAIREIARTKKIMASQLTALGLARAGRWSSAELIKAMEFELKRLADYHRSTFDQEPDLEDFIRVNDLDEVARDGLAALRKRKTIGPWSRRLVQGEPAKVDKASLPRTLSQRGLSFYATHGDRRIYSPTADQNLVVAGGGEWGFALLHLIGQRILEERRYNNASLTLFEPRPERAARMNELRAPEGRFENRRLPRNAFVTSDPTSAFRKASEVILATEPKRMPDQLGLILHRSEQPLKLVLAACGFETQSLRLPCQVAMDLAAQMGREDVEIYTLVGPVEEEDLVEGNQAAAVLAGPKSGLEAMADLFNWPPVELERSFDPLGVQAASILARVYAMWGNVLTRTGELKGPARLGGYMAKTAAEALQLGLALGGRAESFSSASQAWTATFVAEALTGATNRFGRKLGGLAKKRREDLSSQARKLHQALEAAGQKNPAYHDLKTALLLARKHGLKLPILEEAGLAIWADEV